MEYFRLSKTTCILRKINQIQWKFRFDLSYEFKENTTPLFSPSWKKSKVDSYDSSFGELQCESTIFIFHFSFFSSKKCKKFSWVLMLVEEWLNLKLLYSHQILRRQNLHPRRQTLHSDHAYQLHFTLFNMNNVFFLFLVQTFFKSLCYLIRPIFIPLFILPWSSFLFVPSFVVVNSGDKFKPTMKKVQ